MDTFDKNTRSNIMRSVKSSKNKSTELKLILIFKKNRIAGWRRNYKLIGKPDFTFRKERIVVFVDGCFWHGHNCRNTKPEDNKDYWNKKLENNKKRDEFINKTLEKKGWKVIRVWECEIKKLVLPEKLQILKEK